MSFVNEILDASAQVLTAALEVFVGTPKKLTYGAGIDRRLAKLEIARHSLTEALSAVQELQVAAQENKRDLAMLNYQIAEARAGRRSLQQEILTLKKLAEIDAATVKATLAPSRAQVWGERLVGAVIGVVGSIGASYAWEYFIRPHL